MVKKKSPMMAVAIPNLKQASSLTALRQYISSDCLHRRRTKLSSGRWSNFYFNLKPLMMKPHFLSLIGDLIAHKLPYNTTHVGGMASGGIPLVSATLIQYPFVEGFYVRGISKDHGTTTQIEGLNPEDLKGARVVVVEDVTTSGQSALRVVEIVREYGASCVHVITIVDREEGASLTLSEQGIVLIPLLQARDLL